MELTGKKPWALLILLGLLLSARCGIYSFSGSTLPPDIKTVFIPLFENKTPEFGIDQRITDLLIAAITKDNTLKIAGARNADARVAGTLLQVEDRAGQYDQNEQASDYRITMTVRVTFEDVKKKKTLWDETLTQWGRYSTNRDDGIREAVEKLSADIVNRTVSGW
jgi:hypothetical protein